jgi:hypothetical protein
MGGIPQLPSGHAVDGNVVGGATGGGAATGTQDIVDMLKTYPSGQPVGMGSFGKVVDGTFGGGSASGTQESLSMSKTVPGGQSDGNVGGVVFGGVVAGRPPTLQSAMSAAHTAPDGIAPAV